MGMSIYPSQSIHFEVINVWIYVNKIKNQEGKHLDKAGVEKLARDLQHYAKSTLKLSVNIGVVVPKKKSK